MNYISKQIGIFFTGLYAFEDYRLHMAFVSREGNEAVGIMGNDIILWVTYTLEISTVMKRLILLTALATTSFGFLIVLSGLSTLTGGIMRTAVHGGLTLIGGAVLMGLGVLSLTIYLQTFKDEISGKE